MVQIDLLCIARHSAFSDLAVVFVSIRILLSIVPVADARAEPSSPCGLPILFPSSICFALRSEFAFFLIAFPILAVI
jgi:hypothetical protein